MLNALYVFPDLGFAHERELLHPCMSHLVSSSTEAVASGATLIDGAVASTSAMPAYIQLLVSSVLIMGHCAGMCGPLICAFRFGVRQEHEKGSAGSALVSR